LLPDLQCDALQRLGPDGRVNRYEPPDGGARFLNGEVGRLHEDRGESLPAARVIESTPIKGC
jgi:hypothetical protein